MCGFIGLLNWGGLISEADGHARAMADAIEHRGPDDEGFWRDPNGAVILGHRRLAIVDLTAAHIHIGGPGSSGPVIIPIPNIPLHISGSWGQSWTWAAADLQASAATGINAFDDFTQACAAGGCYLNWHTTASPGGALRVNLCPQNRAANTINSINVCAPQQ